MPSQFYWTAVSLDIESPHCVPVAVVDVQHYEKWPSAKINQATFCGKKKQGAIHYNSVKQQAFKSTHLISV